MQKPKLTSLQVVGVVIIALLFLLLIVGYGVSQTSDLIEQDRSARALKNIPECVLSTPTPEDPLMTQAHISYNNCVDTRTRLAQLQATQDERQVVSALYTAVAAVGFGAVLLILSNTFTKLPNYQRYLIRVCLAVPITLLLAYTYFAIEFAKYYRF